MPEVKKESKSEDNTDVCRELQKGQRHKERERERERERALH
jgi:hypothetical protein